MRWLILIGLLMTSACQKPFGFDVRQAPRPSGYVHFSDRMTARLNYWGLYWSLPCLRWEKTGDTSTMSELPDDQCFKMDPPRRWRGLWRNPLGLSKFCPAPAKKCDSYPIAADQAWLEIGQVVHKVPDGMLYSVEFTGRRNSVDGNFEGLDHEIIVDKMISVKLLGPDREPITKQNVYGL